MNRAAHTPAAFDRALCLAMLSIVFVAGTNISPAQAAPAQAALRCPTMAPPRPPAPHVPRPVMPVGAGASAHQSHAAANHHHAAANQRAAAAGNPLDPWGADEWVRTRDGWEKAVWRRPRARQEPHPAVVAGLIALASIASLVAFCPSVGPKAK